MDPDEHCPDGIWFCHCKVYSFYQTNLNCTRRQGTCTAKRSFGCCSVTMVVIGAILAFLSYFYVVAQKSGIIATTAFLPNTCLWPLRQHYCRKHSVDHIPFAKHLTYLLFCDFSKYFDNQTELTSEQFLPQSVNLIDQFPFFKQNLLIFNCLLLITYESINSRR